MTKKIKRDNFTQKTIERLRSRVNGICSKPDCRISCIAAKKGDKEGLKNIGIGAHICAASPGGPRYDKKMTVSQRRSIDNAIWLCENHAKEIDIIDNGLYRYSKVDLEYWKKAAEKDSRKQFGKKYATDKDATDLLTTALTGQPISLLSKAVHNVCEVNDSLLEQLDPRFSVRTSYANKATTVEIRAKQPVSIIMKVDSNYLKDFIGMHKDLTAHGKSISIDSSAITFEGSELIKKAFENIDTIRISKQEIEVTQKLWIKNSLTNETENFDDFSGAISGGTESFSLKGNACKDMITLGCYIPMNEKQPKLNLFVNIEKWSKCDVRTLPFLNKLFSLFNKLNQGWTLHTSLEFNGEKVFESKNIDTKSSLYITEIATFLSYTNFAKIIAIKLNINIPFNENIEFTAKEHQNMAYISGVLNGEETYNEKNIESNPKTDLVIDSNNLSIFPQIKEPIYVEFVQEEGKEINIFGITALLPPLVISLNSVLPKIVNPKEDLIEGSVAIVEWIPQIDFIGKNYYEGFSFD